MSNSAAKPKPICTPTNSPASAIAAIVNCIAKPSARPTRTCSTASSALAQVSASGADCFSVEAISKAMTKPSASLARAGISGELKPGAAASKAKVRSSGQKNSPSQRTRSASPKLSTASPRSLAQRQRRAFEVVDELAGRPRRGEVEHGEQARHEAQGQVVHPRRRLQQPDDEAGEDRGGEERCGDQQRHQQHVARGGKDYPRGHRM